MGWGEKEVLYSFKGGKDGKYPTYPGLIFDKAGNLYGTTFDGGIGPLGGFGTVFELTPKADGSWTETVLHRFTGGRDGAFPYSGLVLMLPETCMGQLTSEGDWDRA